MIGMPRSPKSPEGARVNVTVRLPRPHLEVVEAAAERNQMSRSDVIISLIRNSKLWKANP